MSKYADQVDHPLGWIKEAATKDSEHEIQKRAEEFMDREIQVSILRTIYKQLFHTKVFFNAFL